MSKDQDTDTGVVPIKAAQAMQHDSVATTDAVDTPQPPKVAPIEKKAPSVEDLFNNTFSTCGVNMMFTLGLADQKFRDGSTKTLSKWNAAGVEYNLYNPFRKGGRAKDSEVEVPSGILRQALSSCMNAVSLMNSSSILYLGKPKEVYSALTTAIDRVAEVCTSSLKISPNLVLGVFSEEDGSVDEEAKLKFSDVIRVTSWLSMDWRDEMAAETPVMSHEAMVNFYVNVGALYDSTDKLKMIRQYESILRLMAEKQCSPNTSILFAINLSAEDLIDAEIRELLGVLLEEEGEGFELFTRQSMLDSFNQFDFMPKSKKGVLEDLLNPRSPSGDMLLVKVLNPVPVAD